MSLSEPVEQLQLLPLLGEEPPTRPRPGGREAGLSPSPFTEEETEALRGHSSLSDWNLRPLRSPSRPRPFLMRLVHCLDALKA